MVNGKGQSDAEFKGYTKAKLENIEKMMSEFIDSQGHCNKDLYNRVETVEKSQTTVKVQMGFIGAVATFVGGFIMWVIDKLSRGRV